MGSRTIGSSWWGIFRPFFEWLCIWPLLLLVAGLLGAIVWGVVGVEYGVPNLFWHKNRWTQFFAGIGSAWLLGQLCYAGYLLALDTAWMKGRTLRWYLTATWLPLLLLLVLRAMIPAGGNDLFTTTFNEIERWPFVVGLGTGMLTAIFLLIALEKLLRRYFLKPRTSVESALMDRSGAGKVEKPLNEYAQIARRQRMQAIFFGILLLVFIALAASPLKVTVFPALALCLLLALVTAVYSFILLWFPRTAFPAFLILVIVLLAFNQIPNKHRFVGLEHYYDDPRRLDGDSYEQSKEEDCGLINNEDALNAWLGFYRKNHAKTSQDKPKLVVVTASGGGIRSALWTAVVLTKLEQHIPGFFYHVRLITGASGGMLGTAFFAAKLDELREFDRKEKFHAAEGREPAQGNLLDSRTQKVAEIMNLEGMKQGGLREVAQYWVLRDVPGLFWPFPYYQDRGWALEEAWQANLTPALGRSVRSLQTGEKEGWRPSLVFSPMLVEDGRRLLISNLDLQTIAESSGSLFIAEDNQVACDGLYSLSAVEFFRLFPDAEEFRLSTAVRMSASFPYISPAATLPTAPSRRVVDAGYYDNFGVNTAAAWINDNLQWLRDNTSGVVVVQIRDQVSQATRHELGLEDKLHPRTWWQRGLGGVLTPVEGALEGLQAAMLFRSDEQLQILNQLFNDQAGTCEFFTTVIIQCPVKAALSWYLTDSEYANILASVDGQVPSDIRKFLTKDPETKEIIQKNQKRVKSLKNLLSSP